MITESDGLTDNRTCTMARDAHGFLWVSTFSGLNRINLSSGKITRYMENVEFNYRSVMQNDSMIYMGSVQGIYIFNPKDFIGDDIGPEPPMGTQQVLFLFGGGLTLLFSVILFLYFRYNRKKLELREAEFKKTEKQLFLLQIEQIIFTADLPITVSNLAHTLDVSERTLYRNFQQYCLTPGSLLKELKLKKAKLLLKNGGHDPEAIEKIAQKVGYSTQYLKKLLQSTT